MMHGFGSFFKPSLSLYNRGQIYIEIIGENSGADEQRVDYETYHYLQIFTVSWLTFIPHNRTTNRVKGDDNYRGPQPMGGPQKFLHRLCYD